MERREKKRVCEDLMLGDFGPWEWLPIPAIIVGIILGIIAAHIINPTPSLGVLSIIPLIGIPVLFYGVSFPVSSALKRRALAKR